jgi:hypothetical protein
MEQTQSSNETKPIINITSSKSPEGEKEENIINPAIVIKKHLTEIYQRLNQLEAKTEKHVEVTNQKIDTIDRTKLSTQEFRQFVDTLNKTLIEALLTVATADSYTAKTPLKNENTQGGPATTQTTEPNKTQNKEATAASLHPPPRPTPLVSKTHRLNFPLRTNGEIFYVGNGVTAVVGDAVIPSGTKVDEALVVKGTLRTGEACKLLKDVKALQSIAIGRNSIVEGNLVSGGKIVLGLNCQVKGTIQGEIQEAERNSPSRTI